MKFTRIKLENWRNFLGVDVPLERRVFLVGPNASGKSNFLDAVRFLRDMADPQGGFQLAVVQKRGGVSKIRSLHARQNPAVAVEVEVQLAGNGLWTYRLEFTQSKQRQALIQREIVKKGDEVLLDRPNADDRSDEQRLGQTHLEQLHANRDFRELQESLARVRYLHIVPQLVREPGRTMDRARDPYGSDFLEQVATTNKNTLNSRLKRITGALKIAVPQLEKLELRRDEKGVPHLKGLYKHWRKDAGWQTEEQFSDGTLRLLGLLWVLLDGTHPLLLEEPELSLHPGVIRHLPAMMARIGKKSGRQVLVSTHSADLLSDEGIAPEEVLFLEVTAEDTKVHRASDDAQIRALYESGVPMAEAVLPRTAPKAVQQLSLFEA